MREARERGDFASVNSLSASATAPILTHMSGPFHYRPKFVDIRVRKPSAETIEREDAERPCDHVGCARAGAHRAPKGRERANEFWHFCLEHAADYNRRWNYFSGMSDAELADFQRQAETGHRPTWTMRASRNDRMFASKAAHPSGRRSDPFGFFHSGEAQAAAAPEPSRRLTRLQAIALETLSLDQAADSAQIRAKYAELVKRWHPDSNGGDRGAEAQLQRVVQAYQTLKAGGLV